MGLLCQQKMRDSQRFGTLNNKKFAELIVEECVDIAHSEGDDVGYLKNYFGVKE